MQLKGSFRYPPMEGVTFGSRWNESLLGEVERHGAQRVLVLASTTLAGKADLERKAREVLGSRLAAFQVGVRAHTPREDVLTATERARTVEADLIVTIGGSSIVDAGKLIVHCIANDVNSIDDFDRVLKLQADNKLPVAYSIPLVAIPTTLSGGEFSLTAGATDTLRQIKQAYAHRDLMPKAVILDPELTLHTPEELWLSTGMRGLDHAVEGYCSILAHPYSMAASIYAVKLLSAGLLSTKRDPEDLEARLKSMMGIWLSLTGYQSGVPFGASHAISYVLGAAANVPHGLTSCVLLSPILQWNQSANSERQADLSTALGNPNRPAHELIRALVKDLGLPHSLRQVGVTREQFDDMAERCFSAHWVHNNPKKVHSPAEIKEILELAW
ncbi:iron-containing alcohol dehydrogenase [Pseudochelatococcus sp. B33]